MRFEIHLILWVTAAAIVAASLFIGGQDKTEIGSLLTASSASDQDAATPSVERDAGSSGNELPEVNTSARSIFPVATPAVAYEQPLIEVEEAPSVAGIFSTNGQFTAMLVESGQDNHVLVREGAVVGRFVVIDISADAVVLEDTDDDTQQTILLRGGGELP